VNVIGRWGHELAKSNAERQRAYRERHLNDLEGQGERLNGIIKLSTKRTLERLASCYGVTQRAVLEKIIDEAESRLLSKLGSKKQEAYFDKKLQPGELKVTQ
jgi:hypothetical protein